MKSFGFVLMDRMCNRVERLIRNVRRLGMSKRCRFLTGQPKEEAFRGGPSKERSSFRWKGEGQMYPMPLSERCFTPWKGESVSQPSDDCPLELNFILIRC